jgi:ankyrin repeat protein
MNMELIRAIREGDVSRVEELLAGGLNPNFHVPEDSVEDPYQDEVTPLMIAVAAPRSTAEIVRLLLAHGADPFAVSAAYVSATWYASGGLPGSPETEENRAPLAPDHPASTWGGGDVERLRVMLDAGGDPHEFDREQGNSCVFESCSAGDPARLRLLMERGAGVGPSPREPGASPAGFESEYSASGFYPSIPLFAAATSGSLECVKMIVDAGFPVDYVRWGENALSTVGSLEVAEYLWEQGVRPEPEAYVGSPIDEAIAQENLFFLQVLLKDADPEAIQQYLLRTCADKKSPRAVRVLLELGADPNKPDKRNGSPLHSVCWGGDGSVERDGRATEALIFTLIDAGADPNLRSKGKMPLHQAVSGEWGSPTSVRALLKRGADVNARDKDGKTALMIAAEHGELECVRLLLEAGADRALLDKLGNTALDYARESAKIWKGLRIEVIDWVARKVIKASGLGGEEYHARVCAKAQEIVDLLSS